MEAIIAVRQFIIDVWSWVGANAATLIAFFALIYTTRQFSIAREHNRVMVQPLVLWTTSTGQSILKNPQGQVTGYGGAFELKLENFGLAAGKITKYVVRQDDVVLLDTTLPTMHALVDGFVTGTGGQLSKFRNWHAPAPFWLAKDGQINVIAAEFNFPTKAQYDAAKTFVDRFSVEVEYESVYGVKDHTDSRTPNV